MSRVFSEGRFTDFTKGPFIRPMLRFALPVLFCNAFQLLYNTVDTVVIGHALGDQALAAVGSAAAVFEILLALAMGMATGLSITVGRYCGNADGMNIRKAVAASLVITVAFTVILTVGAYILLDPLLRLLHTPEEVYPLAHDYLVPVDSGYDLEAPMYNNEVRYSREVMQYKLESAFPGVELSENMVGWLVVREVSDQGTVLKADVGNMSVTGGEVRTALALRSACFEVRYEGEEAIITTRGFGHGVGMSQYGANSMAAEGKTWREILEHYYTGCTIKE